MENKDYKSLTIDAIKELNKIKSLIDQMLLEKYLGLLVKD